jgi:hypothetical protein
VRFASFIRDPFLKNVSLVYSSYQSNSFLKATASSKHSGAWLGTETFCMDFLLSALNHLMIGLLWLPPFHRWENWGSEVKLFYPDDSGDKPSLT